MDDNQGPKPLIDPSSESSALVRRALQSAREDVPSSEHFEKMLSNLPIGPGGGDGRAGGAGVGAGGVGIATKLGAAMTIALVVGGSAAILAARVFAPSRVVSQPLPPEGAPSIGSVQADQPPTPPAGSVESDDGTPEGSTEIEQPTAPLAVGQTATPAPRVTAQLGQPSGSASAPVPVDSDIDLLRKANAALSSNPSRALQLASDHARLYPASAMALEREMIRIQALIALGRMSEARAAASSFRSHNPGSAYIRRLDQILPE